MGKAKRRRWREEGWKRAYNCKKEADARVKIIEALGYHRWYPYLEIGFNHPRWCLNGSHYSFNELPAYEKVTTPKAIRFLVNNKTEEQMDQIRDNLYLQFLKKVHNLTFNTVDEYYDSQQL